LARAERRATASEKAISALLDAVHDPLGKAAGVPISEVVHDGAIDDAIELAQSDDPRGFETLFRAFGAAVAGYLRARQVSDPDGLANEVFLRAFRTIHTFRGDSAAFRSWLFTIAHHIGIDDSRRRKRRVRESPLDQVGDSVAGSVQDDADEFLAQESVQAMLATLSSDQRDVLVLRVIADLSVDQTAAVLGKSHEAVKALQRRALGALRRHLSDREVVTSTRKRRLHEEHGRTA
jgi:RNA polymerase sigma-70 factor (ECF subfamily)